MAEEEVDDLVLVVLFGVDVVEHKKESLNEGVGLGWLGWWK
jgi:hypothetical protein